MASNESRHSARERQIMDALHRLGEAGVTEVQREMPEPPSYSAVRAMLRILEDKGHVQHRQAGRRYIYEPKVEVHQAGRSALRSLVRTFFSDSPTRAVAALLDLEADKISESELAELSALVEQAREKGTSS